MGKSWVDETVGATVEVAVEVKVEVLPGFHSACTKAALCASKVCDVIACTSWALFLSIVCAPGCWPRSTKLKPCCCASQAASLRL